jgi:Skp family chaperone for outer membrane proteins
MNLRLPLLGFLGLLLVCQVAMANPNAKALSLFQKALKEHQAKNYGAALKLYFDAHSEDPEILALDDQGLLRSASQWLGEQLAADDDDLHAHFQMAELDMLQGLDRMALGHYEKVVQLDPQNPLAKLAGPLIQDLQKRITAYQPHSSSQGSSSNGSKHGPGSSKQSAAQVAKLQQQVARLKTELSQAQEDLTTVRTELQQARQASQDKGELDKLRQEFDTYKAEAEQWKLYKTLYFADPSNMAKLRKLSGS